MPEEKNPLKRTKQQLNNYGRYSGIAFQMVAIIGVFSYAGYLLDSWFSTKDPLFTAFMALAGIAIAIYQIIRQVSGK